MPVRTSNCVSRRDLMIAFGGALTTTASIAGARDRDPGSGTEAAIYTPEGFERALPADALDGQRAIIQSPSRIDLDTAVGQRFARLKSIFSVDGDYSYSAIVTRHVLVPLDSTPFAVVNELEFNTTFITTALPEGLIDLNSRDPQLVTLNSLYTRRFLDPVSMEPIDSIHLPQIDRTLSLTDTLFSFRFSMDLSRRTAAGAILQENMPWYRMGNNVHLTALAIPEATPSKPPRMDTSLYSVSGTALENVSVRRLNADYYYSASSSASLFGWTGYAPDDPVRINSSKAGIKVHTVDELPDLVKTMLIERYPDRLLG